MSKQSTARIVEGNGLVNGVNVDGLNDTIAAIRDKPSLANFKFRARNRWLDGAHNRITVQDYFGTGKELKSRTTPFVMDADEPPVLLGEDRGVNPVEFVLAALSSCLTTSLIYHAAAEGIDISAVESDYEGDIDLQGFLQLNPDVRNGYKEIRVNFTVRSDADREKLEALMKRSPVFDIVTNPTPVRIAIQTV